MNRANLARRMSSKRVLLPRWMARILTPMVFLLGHVAVPMALTSSRAIRSTSAAWSSGWVIFYGSVAVLVGWGNVAFLVVSWEERKLQTRFGEAYLRYKHSVARVPTFSPPKSPLRSGVFDSR